MTYDDFFSGKTALVTGAASGMGRAIALSFARAGADVLVADVDVEGGHATAADVVALGGKGEFHRTDVSVSQDVSAMVERATSISGRLDCAVNGAAIENETGPLGDCEEATFDRLVAVNLKSVFLCMREEIRAMRTLGDGGAIVNIASTSSFRPQSNQAVYTATKHGVIGLTKAGAIDHSHEGIRINAVCPGAIETPMLLSAISARGRDGNEVARRLSLTGEFGQPQEIANAVLWLCSDQSTFTMGHALAVDGGYLAR
jgi:NAD(P)-dependent dehydrogenase (short-subunit alcohol dehydrogenase family)